jgi:DNA-binding transcriptional MerR regulator
MFMSSDTAHSMAGRFRIGELARRTGVSPALLRAWESRYGLLHPTRSEGGFRLYSDDDEARVRLMRTHQAGGMSAAEAAHLALEGDSPPAMAPLVTLDDSAHELRQALERYDEVEAHALMDRLLLTLTLDTFLADVILPCLREIGDRWEAGELSVAQEHFAANVIRGRLLALARGWGQGQGLRAVLACAPGEQHDLALICFGLALRQRGWTITFLGSSTPFDTLAETAAALDPELVLVTATSGERLRGSTEALKAIGAGTRLALAGRGATEAFARSVGADYLETDPVTEADRISREAPA